MRSLRGDLSSRSRVYISSQISGIYLGVYLGTVKLGEVGEDDGLGGHVQTHSEGLRREEELDQILLRGIAEIHRPEISPRYIATERADHISAASRVYLGYISSASRAWKRISTSSLSSGSMPE